MSVQGPDFDVRRSTPPFGIGDAHDAPRKVRRDFFFVATVLLILFAGITLLAVRTAQPAGRTPPRPGEAAARPPAAITTSSERTTAVPPATTQATPNASRLARPSTAERVGLAEHALRRVVEARMPAFRRCYEAERLREPGLEGRVTLQMVIDASGGVSTARVRDETLRSEAVGSCLEHVAWTLRFPASRDGSLGYVFPFEFRPGK